jgi:hypothetical protein
VSEALLIGLISAPDVITPGTVLPCVTP